MLIGGHERFNVTERLESPFKGGDPASVTGVIVTFEAGARIEIIRPGDIVWFAPGEKHWHGAAPTTALTHIAIQEQLDGKVVEWMEKVSDEQYQA